jgi:hypothetical protein
MNKIKGLEGLEELKKDLPKGPPPQAKPKPKKQKSKPRKPNGEKEKPSPNPKQDEIVQALITLADKAHTCYEDLPEPVQLAVDKVRKLVPMGD